MKKKIDSRRIWQIILIYFSALAAAIVCNQSFADHAQSESKTAPISFKASTCEVTAIPQDCLVKPTALPKTTSF